MCVPRIPVEALLLCCHFPVPFSNFLSRGLFLLRIPASTLPRLYWEASPGLFYLLCSASCIILRKNILIAYSLLVHPQLFACACLSLPTSSVHMSHSVLLQYNLMSRFSLGTLLLLYIVYQIRTVALHISRV